MTRRWTDYPLSRFIPIKKIHITELYQAYEERLRFLRADSNRTTTDFPLPVFYYDKPNSKLWGDDYPKADPAHWPPNDSPDNKVRNDHIYNIRYCVPGAISSTASDGAERPDNVLSYSYSFVGNFIKPDDAYYRPYDDANHTGFQPIVDALGQADYTDPTLTAGSVYVKADHVAEVRAMLEQLRVVYVNPTTTHYRSKYIEGDYKGTADAAWSDAKTKLSAASWSAWTSGTVAYLIRVWMEKSGSIYRGIIIAIEHKFVFDLDLEISGMGWNVLPPLSAKLCLGAYGLHDYDPAEGWQYTEADEGKTVTSYAKCSTTSASVEISRAAMGSISGSCSGFPSTQWKGYVLDADIKSYIGSGHGSQEFIITARDDFSNDELDEVRPTADDDGQAEIELYLSGGADPEYGGKYNMAGQCYVVIEPNWKFGAP